MLKYIMIFLIIFLIALTASFDSKASPYCETIPYTELRDFTTKELSNRYCIVAGKSYGIIDTIVTLMETTMESKIGLYRDMELLVGICQAEQKKVKRLADRKKVAIDERCDIEDYLK